MQTNDKEEIRLAGSSSKTHGKKGKRDKSNKSKSPQKNIEVDEAKRIALAKSVAKSFVKKANKRQKLGNQDTNAPSQEQANQQKTKDSQENKNTIGDLITYQSLFQKAQKLYLADEQKYNQDQEATNKDAQYYFTMIKKGTISDQISALKMLVQKRPNRSLCHLQKLIGISRKHNKKQAEGALWAVKELFINSILEDGVKLTAFQYNSSIHGKDKESNIPEYQLIDAYYEHCIKEIYREYVTSILSDLSKDPLEYFRKQALQILLDLLTSKPEIEDIILSILINKIGDTSKKVENHAVQMLCKLLKVHPEMAPVVIHETQLMSQRPSLKSLQKYYTLSFLNKIAIISGGDEQVRIQLFRTYFHMFKIILQNPTERKELVFKKDRTKSKKQQQQEKAAAAKKIKQIKANGDIDEEDNKLVEVILKGVNILMQKSKADLRMASNQGQELKKLLDDEMATLFKLTHHNVFRIQIQVFKLLLQFAKVTQKISKSDVEAKDQSEATGFADRFYRTLYELLLKVHLGGTGSLDEYFGLIFRAVKSDECVPRCVAFIKRLLQMSYVNESNFIAASLLIISEILKARQDIKFALFSFNFGKGQSSEIAKRTEGTTIKLDQADSDDDEEEKFVDVDKMVDQKSKSGMTTAGGDIGNSKKDEQYDPLKREPKYAKADTSQLFELVGLCLHSHPTVRLWAKSLMDGNPVEAYNGDPLLDFSISNFLDRIAYKDPKSKDKLAKFADKRSSKTADYEKPINEYDFKKGERPETLRPEEEFMYKYLKKIDKREKRPEPGSDDELIDENGDKISNISEEEFAQNEIMKEMARLQSGAGNVSDEEDVDVSYSSNASDGEDGEDEIEESVQKNRSSGEEEMDNDGFFSDQDDLEEVQDDSEEEMSGSFDQDEIDEEDVGSDYGDEYDEEMDEQLEAQNNKKEKKKKDKDASIFASADEFAEILDKAAEQESKKGKMYAPKRKFSEFESAQKRFLKKKNSPKNPAIVRQNLVGFSRRQNLSGGSRGGSRGGSPSFRGAGGPRGSQSFRGGQRGSFQTRGSNNRGRGSQGRGQSFGRR